MKLSKSEQTTGINPLLVETIRHFLRINEEIKNLEEELKADKAYITGTLNNIEANNKGQKILDVEGLAKCMLIMASRENFSIKQAKEKYNEDQFRQFVSPFISVSEFPKLTITYEKE